MDLEWLCNFRDSSSELEIEFFSDRSLVTVRIELYGEARLEVASVEARTEDDWQELDYVVERENVDSQPVISIQVQTLVRAEFVRITLSDRLIVPFRITLAIRKEEGEDIRGVQRGLSWASGGDLKAAVSEFERYSRMYSEQNPFVNVHLAHWHRELGHLKRADEFALRACARGNLEACQPAYEAVQELRAKQTLKSMRCLQGRAQKWEIEGEPGAVILETNRELMFEITEAVHAERNYSLMEIRSSSAGRMLTELGFRFDATRESILYASCRIIRANDEIEEVSPEQMTIRDDEQGSSLVTVERERVLSWILPELKPGDLLESRFHKLFAGVRVNGESWPGRIDPICDIQIPTLNATCSITAPPEVGLRIVPFNCNVPVQKLKGIPGRSRTIVRLERSVPASQTGLIYKATLLDPSIAIGPANATWKDLARHVKATLLGDHADDPLPARLASIVESSDDTESALEFCFYMLRDEIKYASTRDGKNRIGVSGRADEIIESGVGDCGDKSFLLHLVCRDLGLPHEFVAFDADTGTLREDVPVHTFDHALLRVELNGKELWLDASDRFGVFGSAPMPLQGMSGLLLDDAGTIVRVREDDPHENRIVIRERLEGFEDDMLAGSFELEAHGTAGRVLDEHVKAACINGDPVQGTARALLPLLPELSLHSVELRSEATQSKCCHLSGRHARGRLSRLNGSGHEFTRLEWLTPHLPFWEWQHLDCSRRVRLGVPIKLSIELELGSEVLMAHSERSTIENVENELFSMSESVVEAEGRLVVRREFVLRHGFVSDPLTRLIPELCESVACASSLALRLQGRGEVRARAAQEG